MNSRPLKGTGRRWKRSSANTSPRSGEHPSEYSDDAAGGVHPDDHRQDHQEDERDAPVRPTVRHVPPDQGEQDRADENNDIAPVPLVRPCRRTQFAVAVDRRDQFVDTIVDGALQFGPQLNALLGEAVEQLDVGLDQRAEVRPFDRSRKRPSRAPPAIGAQPGGNSLDGAGRHRRCRCCRAPTDRRAGRPHGPEPGRRPYRKSDNGYRAAREASRQSGHRNWERVRSPAGPALATTDTAVLDKNNDCYTAVYGAGVEVNPSSMLA